MQTPTADIDDSVLKRLVPLGALSSQARRELLNQAKIETLPKGAYVFQAGDTDDDAVYLLDGEIQLFAGKQMTNAVRGGTAAAYHPLSPRRPREHSARARDRVTVLRIDRPLLDKKLTWFQAVEEPRDSPKPLEPREQRQPPKTEVREWKLRVARSSLFSRVPAANIQKVFESMKPRVARNGEVMIRQGDEGDFYYVIEQGRCAVTRRATEQSEEIKLAELGMGDGFGEQALLSGGRHSVTVTMMGAGTLRRLDKHSFASLIKAPVLRTVSQTDAEKLSRDGAVWLDVRLAEEHRASGMKGGLNIPLAKLRHDVKTLAKGTPYIVYCDTGQRSSAGAFFLTQEGFDAYVLAGGLMGLKENAAEQKPSGETKSEKQIPTLDADITLSELQVAMAQLNQQIEEAVRRRVDRESLIQAQQEAVQRLQRKGKAADQRIAQEMAKRVEAARKKAEQDAQRTGEILKAARRAQLELESAKKTAEEQATKQRAAVEKLRADLTAKLSAGKRKLEAEYAEASRRIEALGQLKREAESGLGEERRGLQRRLEQAADHLSGLERELIQARQDHETAKSDLHELDRRRDNQLAELGRQEQALRSEAEAQLREGRERLESELARNMHLLEEAKREQEKAEAAKRKAEQEAARIDREAQAANERVRQESAARLRADRKRLEREAEQIKRQLDMAKRMQEKAEAARQTALDKVRKLQSLEAGVSSRATETAKLEQEVAQREAELNRARERMEAARKASMDVEVSKDIVENVESGRRTAEKNLGKQLEAERDEWKHHERAREANLKTTSGGIQEALRRISEQFDRERREEEEATEDMLAEIQSQLDSDSER